MKHVSLLAGITLVLMWVATACGADATPTGVPAALAPLQPSAVATSRPEPSATSQPTVQVSSPTPAALTLTATSGATDGGNADVLHVRAVQSDAGTWTFHVTVEHPDTGWEDYADGWDVVTPDGTVLKPDPDSSFTRLLLHPHENEQPFTRSQSGIEIPESVTQVRVRAHDLVDGYGGREVVVDLSSASGPGFEVQR
jgi:hypothetical protein